MDLQEQRDLVLLSEVEKDGGISQRTLAKRLGVALGLTNLYLKRLASKGYIKVTTIPRHRIKYLLTPKGMAKKARLTYQYMQYSLNYYRDIRRRLKHVLSDVSRNGGIRVVVYGTGELAELAYLTLREMDLTLVGFIGDEANLTFLAYPVRSVEALQAWDFDAVLIADLGDAKKNQARMVDGGVQREKIITP